MKTTSKIACLIAMLASPLLAQREPLTGYVAPLGIWVLCADGVAPLPCLNPPVPMYMIGVRGAEEGERVSWAVSYVNEAGEARSASGTFAADNIYGYANIWFLTDGVMRSWTVTLSRAAAAPPTSKAR